VNINAQITFLPSGNLSLSRAFYTEILGLEVTVDQGSCLIFGVTDSSFVAVCERGEARSTTGVIVTFVTDDVDAWCERILAAGGRIDSGPEHSDRYGIYHVFLSDPDGNLIEIQTFDDPAWASRP